jgi:folate-dependent phosphoribosylglycinamide formyltransferase PurN
VLRIEHRILPHAVELFARKKITVDNGKVLMHD